MGLAIAGAFIMLTGLSLGWYLRGRIDVITEDDDDKEEHERDDN